MRNVLECFRDCLLQIVAINRLVEETVATFRYQFQD